jgi:CDP-6-deoxy-D-xylo-4-hexulose-3-dehydrase
MDSIQYPLASSTWGSEEIHAIERVLQSGNFTMGENVLKFEKEFADYIGVRHALMVNSGSSANLLMMAGLRYRNSPLLSEGDEVIVPAVSWSTTFFPVQQLGMVLNFVDIDLDTLNIDTSKIEKAITSRTKAIFAVNLLGNPCDFESLKNLCEKYGLILIEDNCESLGAQHKGMKTGGIGIAGTHSFFFSHHMCTMEGGMVTTNDTRLFEAMISLRAHGWIRGLPNLNSVAAVSEIAWDNQFKFVLPGYNFRPLEIEAAAGLEQLKKLPNFVDCRIKNSQIFLELAKGFPEIRTQLCENDSSWFGFSLVLEGRLSGKREVLVKRLSEAGIESRPIVAGNFLKNPVISYLPHVVSDEVKNAEKVDRDGLFIGNHHYSLEIEFRKFFEVLASCITSVEEGKA